MAAIVAHLRGTGGSGTSPNVLYTGTCRVEGMTGSDPDITWSVLLPPTLLATVINLQLMNAAIAAATAAGYSIGLLDVKSLAGGLVGL